MKIINNVLAGFFFLFTQILYAQGVSYNKEFQVNTYATNDYAMPKVGHLLDGGFVLCWERDSPTFSNECDICGQIFDSHLSKRGIEFQVNTYENYYQRYPSVSCLLDSGFVVCWQSYGQDGSFSGIYGQVFNKDGSKRNTEIQINTHNYNSQEQPSVDYLLDGGFVVCWDSDDQDGSFKGIYGQLFNSDGSKRGSEFQVNTYTSGSQCEPCVSHLIDGGFVVCWESVLQDGIYSQVFNSDGSKRGSEFQVNTYILGLQRYSSVDYLLDGGFVVCWESHDQDGSSSVIYGQLFNSDGSKRGSEFQVNTYTSGSQCEPSVSHLIDGGFVVCWMSSLQDGSNYGIYSQLFYSDGTKRGSEFQVNTYTDNNQIYPDVSYLINDGFFVCWTSWYQNGSSAGIYGKYYLNEEINHPLKLFSLISPTFDAILNTNKRLFLWHHASALHVNLPWEMEYLLFLDDNENFSNPFIFSAGSDTICTIGALKPGTTYFWKVLAKNLTGDSLWSSETNGFFVSYDASTDVEETIIEKPQGFKLFSNYPNPFNPETVIKYSLPVGQALHDVIVKIYDALGRLIIILTNEQQKLGVYTVKWNGRNVVGEEMPTGMYICVVQAGSYKTVRKMLLIR